MVNHPECTKQRTYWDGQDQVAVCRSCGFVLRGNGPLTETQLLQFWGHRPQVSQKEPPLKTEGFVSGLSHAEPGR